MELEELSTTVEMTGKKVVTQTNAGEFSKVEVLVGLEDLPAMLSSACLTAPAGRTWQALQVGFSIAVEMTERAG